MRPCLCGSKVMELWSVISLKHSDRQKLLRLPACCEWSWCNGPLGMVQDRPRLRSARVVDDAEVEEAPPHHHHHHSGSATTSRRTDVLFSSAFMKHAMFWRVAVASEVVGERTRGLDCQRWGLRQNVCRPAPIEVLQLGGCHHGQDEKARSCRSCPFISNVLDVSHWSQICSDSHKCTFSFLTLICWECCSCCLSQ